MRDGFKGASAVAFCLVILSMCLPVSGQSTHWNAAGGDWSADANWTDGEPVAGIDAYVGSAGGRSTAAVTIVQAGEECRDLYLGDGEGNDGTLTIEPGGCLTADWLYVGLVGSGTVQQNGGACNLTRLTVGYSERWDLPTPGEGTFELLDGNLDVGYISVAPTDMSSGQFTQRGGTITTTGMQVGSPWSGWLGEFHLIDGRLINSGYLALDQRGLFRQSGGYHQVRGLSLTFPLQYDKPGGELVVTQNFGMWGGGFFTQWGGVTHVFGDLTVDGMGNLHIYGGSLHVDGNMLIAKEQYDLPDIDFLNPDGNVIVGGTLTLRGGIELQCGVGTQLHLRGRGFVNELPGTVGLYGYNKLAVVYEGGPGLVATYEAAGEDMGPDPNGFIENFTIGTLRIGGEDDVGVVRLVDDFENTPGDSLPEAVYVEHLLVGPGCTLDLNGLNLYYLTGGVDPAATVDLNGGCLVQVPEPGTFALLALGGLAAVRRRRR